MYEIGKVYTFGTERRLVIGMSGSGPITTPAPDAPSPARTRQQKKPAAARAGKEKKK